MSLGIIWALVWCFLTLALERGWGVGWGFWGYECVQFTHPHTNPLLQISRSSRV